MESSRFFRNKCFQLIQFSISFYFVFGILCMLLEPWKELEVLYVWSIVGSPLCPDNGVLSHKWPRIPAMIRQDPPIVPVWALLTLPGCILIFFSIAWSSIYRDCYPDNQKTSHMKVISSLIIRNECHKSSPLLVKYIHIHPNCGWVDSPCVNVLCQARDPLPTARQGVYTDTV